MNGSDPHAIPASGDTDSKANNADVPYLNPQAVWRNTLTVAGGLLAVLSLLFMIGLLIVELISEHRSPYIGLFAFLVLPGFLVLGLMVALIGVLRARRRDVPPNDRPHRTGLSVPARPVRGSQPHQPA